jgi:hypothetical protein
MAKRYFSSIRYYYEKKAAKMNTAIAIKAVSNELARASYYVMSDRAVFDEERLFGCYTEEVNYALGLAHNHQT